MNDAPGALLARNDEVWLEGIEADLARGAGALRALQRDDGHWVFELEADATIPAEYILLRQHLGEPDEPVLEGKIGNYLRRIQGEHGGWPLFHGGAFDLSASVKAYFCLKMIGDDPEAPHMARARAAILAHGGAGRANVFTRMLLCLYGELSWKRVPTIPVEMILMPRWFPMHISRMSYWARTVLVPLLVLQAMRARARNPRGVRIQELFVRGRLRLRRRRTRTHQQRGWAMLFQAMDRVLTEADPVWPRPLRQKAIARCVEFVTERLNGEDGLGAIYPAMANAVMMYDALGYPPDHPDRAIARRSIEKLLVIREDEAYCQPCVSPVWDTALVAHTLLEVGGEAAQAVPRALDWLRPLQELEVRGDWAEQRPHVRPGGWAFQYRNAHYPDLDDTAVVVMAMDRARHQLALGAVHDEAISRGAEWTEGLQSANGGWGAFDADNVHGYLNNIPFSDHGALLDPPTADVSARCIGMMAQLGETAENPRLRAAIDFLEREQEEDGSWFGRWGVNYIYGTWSAMIALNAAGFDATRPSLRRGADWLIGIQNPDGGWGEDCESYRLDYRGYEPFASTASQTAWALLALMAAGEVDHPAVARGIAYLRETQDETGLWQQDAYTGGGFPRVFYLRYHGYPKFFPLWAMARYRNLRRGNARRVSHGM